ncbi:MAG: hypothetical protein MEP57_07215 [Microvirga sp.]|nr:hypothetical protein [Microvirga sp.]
MTEALQALLEAAQTAAEQQERQRRSFAYGKATFEKAHTSPEMVDRQAEELARKNDEWRD